MVKGETNNDEIDELISFYKTDFNKIQLTAQLETYYTNYPAMKNKCQHDVLGLVKGFSPAEKTMLSEVMKMVRLLLVMPATNAISERLFSTMRCIKTYLRSTMLQERLNAIMLLHVHIDLTDELDLKSISNQFVCKLDYRKSKFPIY